MITASDLADDDTDTEGDSLTVTGVSNESGGTAVLDAGKITFTPDPDLCGDDAASFDYTVEDGNGGTATGTVTIDLDCENDAPVAGDDTVSVTEDTATDVTATLLDNDTDVDTDDTLSITDVSTADRRQRRARRRRRHLHPVGRPVRHRRGRLRLRRLRRHDDRLRPRHRRHHLRQRRTRPRTTTTPRAPRTPTS